MTEQEAIIRSALEVAERRAVDTVIHTYPAKYRDNTIHLVGTVIDSIKLDLLRNGVLIDKGEKHAHASSRSTTE